MPNMNPSKLYVPDPQKWVKFYKNLAEGKIQIKPTNQMRGGGRISHSFIAPIDKYLKECEEPKASTPVKLVSTTEQMVDQAKSELEREGRDLKTIAQAIKPQTKSKRRSGKSSSEGRKNKRTKLKKSPRQHRIIKTELKNKSKIGKRQTGGHKTTKHSIKRQFIRFPLFERR